MMRNRLPVFVILATVMIDAMGIGLIIPVMPDLIQEVTGGDLGSAAVWGGILSTVFAFMQFLCGPLLGNLSDRFGRRPVLLVSLAVMSADYVIMAVAHNIWILVIGRIVAGITAATYATAMAYMADMSDAKEKAKAFGMIGAAMGVGFVFGPALGGFMGQFGTRAPFWAAAALAGGNALLGWLVLKETVTDANRRAFEWRRSNPLGALQALGKLPAMTNLLIVFFFYQIAAAVYPAIWPYFIIERFGWEEAMIGLSLTAYGLCFAIVQATLIGPFINWFGNRRTVVIGLGLEVAALIYLAVISNGILLFIGIPVAALSSVGLPALQSIMSRRVSDDAQGELQGISASLTSLAHIAAPLVMTQTFAYFSDKHAPLYLPGAPFVLAAALLMIAIVVFAKSRRAT
jgi:DHA1 family tetracycline resistance protein-like MFS transporter